MKSVAEKFFGVKNEQVFGKSKEPSCFTGTGKVVEKRGVKGS